MFKKLCITAVLATVAMSAASAGTITGPSLSTADGGWANTGLAFTALTDATLNSFVFRSQNRGDTVVLSDGKGLILNSVSTSGGLLSVNWALTAGKSYLLLQLGNDNAMYTNDSSSLVHANSEIRITDAGVFGCAGAVYNNCSFKGQDYWTAFTDFTTSARLAEVPEPASLGLLGLGLAAVAAGRRRKSA